jgi:hypothetical protein
MILINYIMDITKLISEENSKEIIKKGEINLINNRFFKFIDIFMGDPNLRIYIDEFFGDWDEIKTVIMIMKTYQVIDAELQNHEFENGKNNNEGKRKLIIGLLKELLSNSKCRQELIINMNIFMGGKLNECEKIIKEKKNVFQIKND